MKKRTWFRVFCSLIAACLLVSSAAAGVPSGGDVSPAFLRIVSITTDLDISADGQGDCMAFVDLVSSTDVVELKVAIQYTYNGNFWITLESWTEWGSNTVAVYGSLPDLTPGLTYRALATAKVYNSSGTLMETATNPSVTIKYNGPNGPF